MREALRPHFPRILALLGASVLVAAAVLCSWMLSPGRDAAWFGLYYVLMAAVGGVVAFSVVVGVFLTRRAPAWGVGLAGALGAAGISFTAWNLDFQQVVATHKGSQGHRAILLVDDSAEIGADLVFRVEHPDGSLAGEERIPGPQLFFDSGDVKKWALRLRDHGGQLQVVTSKGDLLAWYSPATGNLFTRTFDPAGRN